MREAILSADGQDWSSLAFPDQQWSEFWGLQKDPFGPNPDLTFLYRGKQQEETLTSLILGVQRREGIIVLSGEVGTGKTMMLACLRDFLKQQQIKFASLFSSLGTADQFLEMTALGLDLPCQGASREEIHSVLGDFLFRQAAGGNATVLIVDEAQNLSDDVLEEIRLLSSLESPSGKLLQTVLAGQPEFESKLEQPQLRQLRQQIDIWCRLQPFNEAETREYIARRLARAGLAGQKIFSQELSNKIHACSQGIPRLINGICDHLMMTAFDKRSKVASVEMLASVAEGMSLSWPPAGPGETPEAAKEEATPLREVELQPAAEIEPPAPRTEEPVPSWRPAWASQPIDEGAAAGEAEPPPVPDEHPPSAGKKPAKEAAPESKPGMAMLVWMIAILSLVCIVIFMPQLEQLFAPPRAGGGPLPDQPPVPQQMAPAQYTSAARRAGFHGKVFAIVTVNPEGAVTNIEFPMPMAFDLDFTVREVATHWRFAPAMRGGSAVTARSLVEVPFK